MSNNLIPWLDDDRLARRRNEVDEEDQVIDAEWEEVCPICQEMHERVTREHCPARRVRSRLITFGREPSPFSHVLEDLIEVPIENWLARRRRKK